MVGVRKQKPVQKSVVIFIKRITSVCECEMVYTEDFLRITICIKITVEENCANTKTFKSIGRVLNRKRRFYLYSMARTLLIIGCFPADTRRTTVIFNYLK